MKTEGGHFFKGGTYSTSRPSGEDGGGRFFKRGTCSTSWPSGWALIRGRAFIRALPLILGYNRHLPSHIQHVFMG